MKDGKNAYVGLPERERQALIQSQTEKYPQEFAPEIERYLRGIADGAEKK